MVYIIFILLWHCITKCDALYLSSSLETKEDWHFIERYCFLSKIGELQFDFTYPVTSCCHNILLYYDIGGQWSSVYNNDIKDCFEKESVLHSDRHQLINLTTPHEWSGCEIKNISGEMSYHCRGGRSFRTPRERWWYITISNCQAGLDNKGINIKYDMLLTNGKGFFTKHFSADEFGILETYLTFMIVFSGMLVIACRNAVLLTYRQMLHSTYKLFVLCVILEVMGAFAMCVSLGRYAATGLKHTVLKIIGQMLGSSAEVIFLVLLLLLGKGYTITRGQLSNSGSVKLTIFSTIYSVIALVLFFYEYVFFDPGKVLYVYESPAGYGLITLRLTGWVWFTYGILFTLKHYPEKNQFYYPLYTIYSTWFFSVPIMVMVATFAIPRYMRAKVVTALELCIDFVAYIVFLILTRPSATNTNFPYHVRTTQIGIASSNGVKTVTQNFPHNVYGVSSGGEFDNCRKQLTDLFTANQQPKSVSYNVRADTLQRESNIAER